MKHVFLCTLVFCALVPNLRARCTDVPLSQSSSSIVNPPHFQCERTGVSTTQKFLGSVLGSSERIIAKLKAERRAQMEAMYPGGLLETLKNSFDKDVSCQDVEDLLINHIPWGKDLHLEGESNCTETPIEWLYAQCQGRGERCMTPMKFRLKLVLEEGRLAEVLLINPKVAKEGSFKKFLPAKVIYSKIPARTGKNVAHLELRLDRRSMEEKRGLQRTLDLMERMHSSEGATHYRNVCRDKHGYPLAFTQQLFKTDLFHYAKGPGFESLFSGDWSRFLQHFHHFGRDIQELHASGLIHRDLKPLNIVIDEEDHFHPIDYDMVVDKDELDAALKVANRKLFPFGGSPGYVDPNFLLARYFQVTFAEYDSTKADVWSYAMAFMHMIFKHHKKISILHQVGYNFLMKRPRGELDITEGEFRAALKGAYLKDMATCKEIAADHLNKQFLCALFEEMLELDHEKRATLPRVQAQLESLSD